MTNSEIYNLRKDYQTFALKVQSDFFASPNNIKLKIRYEIISKIYRELILKNNEKDIKDYLYSLVSIAKGFETKYDILFKDFKRGRDVSKSSLNEIAYRINAYNESINLINKHLVKKTVVVKKEEPKKVETKKVEEKKVEEKKTEEVKKEPIIKIEEKKEEKKKEVKPKFVEVPTEETLYSDEIIMLIKKYNKLDKESPQCVKILKQIYELREKRKEKYIDLIGNEAISLLCEIDSLEMMIASASEQKNDSFVVNAKEYTELLTESLEGINEYHFTDYLLFPKHYESDNSLNESINQNRFDKHYSKFMKKYKNLISSLFESESFEFVVDGVNVNTEDLISYLSIYNLEEGYNVFKGKNSKFTIGTKKIDKKEYEREVEFLKKCIKTLCTIAKEKIGNKKITINDNTLDANDLKEIRYQKFNNIRFLINRGIGHGR